MALQYKVMTQKDKYFRGKFDPEKLEDAINTYARDGWRVISVTTASLPSHFGGSNNRDEIIVVFEKMARIEPAV